MTSGNMNRQWLAQAQGLAGLATAQGQGLGPAQEQGLGAPGFSEAEMENARRVLEFLHGDDEGGPGPGPGPAQGQTRDDNMSREQAQYRHVSALEPGPEPALAQEPGLAQQQDPTRRPSGGSIHSNNSSCRFLCSPVSLAPPTVVSNNHNHNDNHNHHNNHNGNSGSQIENSISRSRSHSLSSNIGSRVTFGHSHVSCDDDEGSGYGDSGNGNSNSGSGGNNGSMRSLSWLLGT